MSASKDDSQKFTFLYSNLYQIHSPAKPEKSDGDSSSDSQDEKPIVVTRNPRSHVIKAGSREAASANTVGEKAESEKAAKGPVVSKYEPMEFMRPFGALAKAPVAAGVATIPQNPVIDSLKENLKTLTDLQSRLRFMLQEIEDLTKE